MTATRKFTAFSAVLIVAGLAVCSRRPDHPQPWLWPGANPQNTLVFSQRGTRPGRLNYRRLWDAEHLPTTPFQAGPVVDAAQPSVATADLDADPELEILPSGPHRSLDIVLDHTGIATRDAQLSPPVFSRVLLVDRPEHSAIRQFQLQPNRNPVAWHFRLNGQPVLTVTDVVAGIPGYRFSVLDSNGSRLWSFQLAPFPMLWAVADLDADGSEDLLLGTYGEEHGRRSNSFTDSESTYCIALKSDGSLLWRAAFGGSDFLGCRAAVADIDADQQLEVCVAIYTWHNRFGGLRVLDAATGRLRAGVDGPTELPASHTSVGLADLDNNGRCEIITATAGRQSWTAVWRFASDTLKLDQRHLLGESRDSTGRCWSALQAIGDLDGDGSYELVFLSEFQRPLCPDPVFYPTRSESCRVEILTGQLRPLLTLPLPAPCRSLVLGDIVPGGNLEILTRSDRLTLFSADRR